MIDAHIHLDQYKRDVVKNAISIWQEHEIDGVVAVATNLSSSYEILKLKQEFPHFVRAAIGHHPEAPPPTKQELEELVALIKSEKHMLSGIGEIGLPTYQKNELLEQYSADEFDYVLEAFLQVANEVNLPVALHAVHKESEIALSFLKKHGIQKAHFHWLKAPSEVINEIISLGYYVSVTPEVCYRKRDIEMVKQIPIGQLLIETDGPWQHSGLFAKRQTSPLFLKEICSCLSNVLTIPIKELTKQIDNNTNKLYPPIGGAT
jgi:TatD DNase family protein